MKNNLYCDIKENKNTMVAKRVNIVSIKMVKEGSILYKERKISSPSDAANIAIENN